MAEAVTSHRLTILSLGGLKFHKAAQSAGGRFHRLFRNCGPRSATDGWVFVSRDQVHLMPTHTAHFQGTASIRPEVMTRYHANVLCNILRIGSRKIFILNGHIGNIRPGRAAIAQGADSGAPAYLLRSTR